jgi:hypothetical protein
MLLSKWPFCRAWTACFGTFIGPELLGSVGHIIGHSDTILDLLVQFLGVTSCVGGIAKRGLLFHDPRS